MDLSIIIVGYKCCPDIENAVISIHEHFKDISYEIILVNNYAGDELLPDLIARHPDIILIDNGINSGFGVGNNAGLAVAKGKYVCFLNPDIIIVNSILPLLSVMESDGNIGLIGPLLRNIDRTVQLSHQDLPSLRYWFDKCFYVNTLRRKLAIRNNGAGNDPVDEEDIEAGWVSGAYMLTRSDLMEKLGGFDPAIFMYNEDVDLCWRVHDAGYRILFSSKSEAIHIGGVTSDSKSDFKARTMVTSLVIVWNKHFSEKDIRILLRMTYWSALLKAFSLTVLCALRQGANKNTRDYYRVRAESARNQIVTRMRGPRVI